MQRETMKTAQQWIMEAMSDPNGQPLNPTLIRKIQADALRHASDVVIRFRGCDNEARAVAIDDARDAVLYEALYLCFDDPTKIP